MVAPGQPGPSIRPRRLSHHHVELAVRGVPVGALEVIVAPGDELTVADRRLLAELARHVAAAVQAEQLQAQVEASRARLVAAREEERRRIRRDLHDELGPTLAAIAMEVEQAGLDLGTHPDAAARRLDDVAERIRATVRSVRALVEGLRPPALDELHLDGAVRELVRDLGGGTVEVDLQLEGDLADLPAAVDVAAYRIVGEALTNTLRHSGARRATVALRRTPASVEVLVDDDGVGPGAGGDQARRGLGLRSMAERAEELGGRLSVEARPGGGTRVRAHVPITAP